MTDRNTDFKQWTAEEIVTGFRSALAAGTNPPSALQGLIAKLEPLPWRCWQLCAEALLQLQMPRAAFEILRSATARWPQLLELRYWSGITMRVVGDFVAAESLLREVLNTQPDHQNAAVSLAYMLRELGRIDAACKVLIDFGTASGGGVDAALRSGKFLEECRRPALAYALYRRELDCGTSDPLLLHGIGSNAMALGRFEEGRQYFLAAIDAGLDIDDWCGVWLLLANAQRYTSRNHPDVPMFDRAWRNAALSDAARSSAGFALAKVLDDVGDYSTAADILREANQIEHSRRQWSGERWSEFVGSQIACVDIPQRAPTTEEEFVPVFIVGLPRTGTTLVAERLARHPQVRSRGELNWIPFLQQQLEISGRLRDPTALQEAATIYRTQLLQDDARARWYIDKNPLNFRHLGFIATLFPQTCVIHCRRDLRDTALSIWSQSFAPGDLDFAYDFSDIRAFADGHDRLMAHWRRILPIKIHALDYEHVVAGPRPVLEELGAFIGLPGQTWIDSEEQPPTAISTASVWQARQAVYTRSIGRWQLYQTALPELLNFFPAVSDCPLPLARGDR